MTRKRGEKREGIDLFSTEPWPEVADIDGPTAAALLGDGAPLRSDREAPDALAAAGYSFPDRCPSCGCPLPDPSHLVDWAARETRTQP